MSNLAVSLFSNCGAGDYGFNNAGFQFAVMAELEEDRLEVCKWNHQQVSEEEAPPDKNFIPGDLRDTWKTVVKRYKDIAGDDHSPALLSACPPCQGMSTARSGIGQGDNLESGKQDERNLLVRVIATVAEELGPKLVVVENVPAFLTRNVPHPNTGKGVSAARLLCRDLRKDYRPFPFLTDLADYGVPQHRQRTFLTFVRKDLSDLRFLDENDVYPYPTPRSKEITLKDFLEDHEEEFPVLDAQDNPRGNEIMDQVPGWSDEQYRMAEAIDEPGGSAWENDCDNPKCEIEEVDEDRATCPECGETLPRPTVSGEGEAPRLVKGFRRSSYRRMPLREPAPTVTTASNRIGSSYNIHPTENRLMTPKECARLQGFPEEFHWRNPESEEHAVELFGVNEVRAMIGEAIPPHFTEQHGEVLLDLLKGDIDESVLIPATDERCRQARKTLDLNADLFHGMRS